MSFFVFYIFATALILAQCEGVFQEESEVPHAYTDVGNCSAHRLELRNNRMKTAVQPRETLVTLKSRPGYNFNPNLVSVKRCNGFCPNRWSPSPTRITNKQFIVSLHQDGNPSPLKCVAVEVEEHKSCKCKCTQSPADCKPSQDWNGASCSCQCKDRETNKSQCNAQVGMQWDDDDCSCALHPQDNGILI